MHMHSQRGHSTHFIWGHMRRNTEGCWRATWFLGNRNSSLINYWNAAVSSIELEQGKSCLLLRFLGKYIHARTYRRTAVRV